MLTGIEGVVLRNQLVPNLTSINFLDYNWIVAATARPRKTGTTIPLGSVRRQGNRCSVAAFGRKPVSGNTKMRRSAEPPLRRQSMLAR